MCSLRGEEPTYVSISLHGYFDVATFASTRDKVVLRKPRKRRRQKGGQRRRERALGQLDGSVVVADATKNIRFLRG